MVIQKGYRRLLEDFREKMESEAQEADLKRQVHEILDSSEEPTTPRPAKRPLSRVSSIKLASETAPNPFMKYPRNHESPGRRSPTLSPKKLDPSKRNRQDEPEGPPRKRGKTSI